MCRQKVFQDPLPVAILLLFGHQIATTFFARNRYRVPTGCLLTPGLDSVIPAIAAYKKCPIDALAGFTLTLVNHPLFKNLKVIVLCMSAMRTLQAKHSDST